ncbi:MFS transporter [Candidatus Nitrosocosmicus agrestis]|jgi:MFS family permease|uniref:MFS transporter n=1 Tax=Candidatus Nitrosocosmicus agrestis TaxID=2563600 RepID=UPI00122E29C2|nr:MFS transporter [Candidatus Nitrosocosmicus sp. SS]KAA2283726.1 MFS transporter [Candidatus Nitrosocosmicus sp. SS]KAF0870103.1 MFS transporter [Candidatus Nitrosocosmicus sp. SS]
MPSKDKSTDEKPKGIRNVLFLGLVSFFTDFSTEMILGSLPTFIVNNLGASRDLLGAIEGSSELTSYIFRMISGSLSDKVRKRKIFVLIGYGLSTISKPFFAISSSWVDVFIVRATDRIGKGVRTAPRDALIADSVSDSISGKAFGIHRTIDQMGAIAGPLASFAILQFMDIQYVFLLSLIPGAIAVIILVFFVKEVATKKLASPPTIFGNIKDMIKSNKPFVILVVITGIFSLGAFNFSFILLKASELGVEQSFIPIVYAVINIAHTMVGIPAGILADKIGKEKVLLISYTIFVTSSILMVVSFNNIAYAYFLAAVFGFYVGISETVQRAIIPRYVPSELRGTAYGLYSLVTGVCFFTSNITFGFIWDTYNIQTAVVYSVSLSLIAILSMIAFIKKYNNVKAHLS